MNYTSPIAKTGRLITTWLALANLQACTAPVTPATTFQITSAAQQLHGRDLLYISDTLNVYVYAYPSLKEVGRLKVSFGGMNGLCSNATGDVFVPFLAGYGGTDEFAHGGAEPIGYLSFPYQYARGCAVDPKTGDLAVIGGFEGSGGTVTVYHYKQHRGWRLGKNYPLPGVYNGAYCGYDDVSDLFCDGTTSSSGGFSLAELATTASSFTTVTLAQQIYAPGQIQWDGTYLAIGDAGTFPKGSVVYRFTPSGSSLTEAGEVTLKGTAQVQQFWLSGGKIFATEPNTTCGSGNGCVAAYRYPAGGSAIASVGVSGALGVTLSEPPPR